MTGTEAVGLHRREGIATILLGHGQRANALGVHDWQALATIFEGLAADPALEAVVVTGRGSQTFSAGSDMREWLGAEPDAVDASFAAMEHALTALERIPVPTIARIRGAAVGAGCQLACACDLRVVADDARIGMPIARWGILVPPMFAARLAQLTGSAAALDLLLTGRLLDGTEAVRLGLATRAVPASQLDDVTTALLAALTAHPPSAIRAAKLAVRSCAEPARTHVRNLPPAPAADYGAMQHSLKSFLRRVTGVGTEGAS
ncbi:enoyl-CoA hydratase/isomerase family protein [Streptomyces atratus]|uniref:enoyl-CoA hydratase/isomerase family protein n=1 Tax=Streptomyces atratus TaxID=1893 RepID=UPI00224EED6A|nr:enoyl-CoA hydratase/isomerase family protein [Streptomyces atratus]MCX5339217.1 enoyl-CoA hydratase/isomerase family protein [Streptomyces atratus]